MQRREPVWLSAPREDVRISFPGGIVLSGSPGTPLEQFILAWQELWPDARPPYAAAMIGTDICGLADVPAGDATAVPLGLDTVEGMRVYRRSASLLLLAAARRLFPDARLVIEHSITANGLFCSVQGRPPLSPEEVAQLGREMRALQQADLPIRRRELTCEEAETLFRAHACEDELRLLETVRPTAVTVYELAGTVASFWGLLFPRTGYLEAFSLRHHPEGFLLLLPLGPPPWRFPHDVDFPKVLHQLRERRRWLLSMGIAEAGSLNKVVMAGMFRELVLVAEALHEWEIASIAQKVREREQARLIFIAGPSASGKTTFAKRLGVQLAASAIPAYVISLDDYFVDRDATPRDESGEPDFEAFEAVDRRLFAQQMLALLRGESVRLPRYDFASGKRVEGPLVSLPRNGLLIVEGLHGLNPALLPEAPAGLVFRIYVSALFQLNIDDHNYIPTSDARLLRRIVRDAQARGYSAEETIKRWHMVRRGEQANIFPYQELADVMFNSALPYETAVLKPLAEPLLLPYDHRSSVSAEVRRLLELLSLFRPVDPATVPDNSILREFIGGSIFETVQLRARFP
jgi:uridine kinase